MLPSIPLPRVRVGAVAVAGLLVLTACTDVVAPTATPNAAVLGPQIGVPITPLPLYYLPAFPMISAGNAHTCALSKDWTVRCWGQNRFGQLGVGDRTQASRANRAAPVQVNTTVLFKAITAWDFNTCALDRDGKLYCWGWNFLPAGATNDANVEGSPTPTLVQGAPTFRSISRNCGIGSADDLVYCWNGIAGGVTRVDTPSLETFKSLSVGQGHGCAVTRYNQAVCWGANFFGQLGRGTYGSFSSAEAPWYVEALGSIRSISAGVDHTCAITWAYDAMCWGDGYYGQLAGSRDNANLPKKVGASDEKFVQVVAGSDYTCGLRQVTGGASTALNARCWGLGNSGQLGSVPMTDHQGTFLLKTVAMDAANPGFNALSLANSGFHTCGIDKNGAAFCWGQNPYGQIGNTIGGTVASPRRVDGLPVLLW